MLVFYVCYFIECSQFCQVVITNHLHFTDEKAKFWFQDLCS